MRTVNITIRVSVHVWQYDVITSTGNRYLRDAKPYMGEPETYLEVVARGSVDLECLQTNTGIIDSLEYDEYDDSLLVRQMLAVLYLGGCVGSNHILFDVSLSF